MSSQEFGCRTGSKIFRGVRISIKVSHIVTGNGENERFKRKASFFRKSFDYACKMRLVTIFRQLRRFAAPSLVLGASALVTALLWGQVIEYEANGLKYQTLSRKGLTIIVTRMPNHVAAFGLFQVSISNGSEIYWTVQPEDFAYVRQDVATPAISAGQVVDVLLG